MARSSPTPTSSPPSRRRHPARRRSLRRIPRPQQGPGRDRRLRPLRRRRPARIDPDGLDLHPLKLGDDHSVAGRRSRWRRSAAPFGEQHSLSVGVVSAVNRSVKSLTQFQIEGAIQTDASINPGNSGGPLLDADARVLGINQQIETSSGANDGVGFAVPVSAIKRSVAQLEEDGTAEYAYIGVSSQALYPQLADKLGLDTTFGGLLAERRPRRPGREGGPRRRRRETSVPGGRYRTGGDVYPLSRRPRGRSSPTTSPADLALQAGRKGDPDGPPRRQAARGPGARSASAGLAPCARLAG